MNLITLLVIITEICLNTARIIHDEPEQSQFGFSTPFDSTPGEFMMKEAILYLTPTQIKAYEASQGQNQDQRNQFTEEEMLSVETEIKKQLEQQNIFAINPTEKPILNLSIPPPPVVEAAKVEPYKYYSTQYHQNWTPMPKEEEKQQQHYFFPNEKDDFKNKQTQAESYSYIRFFTDHDKFHETPKLKQYHPPPREHKIESELKFYEEQNQKYKSIPSVEVPKSKKIKGFKPSTLELLEKYRKEQNIEVQDQSVDVPKSEEERFDLSEKEQFEKYAPQFDKTVEDEKFFINLEKENALARAEAILKGSRAVTRQEIPIRRRPVYRDWPKRYTTISLEPKNESTYHRRIWNH